MDIRALYNSLSPENKSVYQQIRTDMRKVYLNAHTNIVGMDRWLMEDDAFLDLLDIKLASLFDRMGLIEGIKPVIDKEEEKVLEKAIESKGEAITAKMNVVMSAGSAKLGTMKPNGGGW